MREIKAIWIRNRLLVSVWETAEKYEVTVFDADAMAFLQGYERSSTEAVEALDYVDQLTRYFEFSHGFVS